MQINELFFKLFFNLVLGLFLITSISYATDSEVEQLPTSIEVKSVLSGKVTVGDLVFLKIKLNNSSDLKENELVYIKDGSNEAVNILDGVKDKPLDLKEGRILSIERPSIDQVNLTLTTYKPGNFLIPSFYFQRDGKSIFKTQEQNIEFVSLKKDKESKPDEIYEPVSISMPRWIFVAAGLLLLLIVLGVLWAAVRFSQRNKVKQTLDKSAPKVLTPIEEFEVLVKELEAKGYLEEKRFKPHYFALSDGCKKFIGQAFQFDAEENTTQELIMNLKQFSVNDEVLKLWIQYFDEMDIVKFTDQRPDLEAAQNLAAQLSKLVTATYRISPRGSKNGI